MDISINDYIVTNVSLIKEKMHNGAIDKLFGDSLNYPKQKNIELSDTDYRKFESLLMEDATITLYKLIASNLVVLAISMSREDICRPKSLKSYAENMNKIYSELKRFEKELDFSVKNNQDDKYIVFSSKEKRDSYHKFIIFMEKIMQFFSIAPKAYKISYDKNIGDIEFLKIACDYNKKINEIFTSATMKVDDCAILDVGFCEMYEQFITNFERNIKTVEEYKNSVQCQEEQKKDDEVKIVSPKSQINEKEQARLSKIKEANELYNRFTIDFMRDLQKEVSLMNRDMYEALINKVERFLKKFPMPLSNNVSIGMATEACAQINKFIETVYEISRNTYSPVVFGK